MAMQLVQIINVLCSYYGEFYLSLLLMHITSVLVGVFRSDKFHSTDTAAELTGSASLTYNTGVDRGRPATGRVCAHVPNKGQLLEKLIDL